MSKGNAGDGHTNNSPEIPHFIPDLTWGQFAEQSSHRLFIRDHSWCSPHPKPPHPTALWESRARSPPKAILTPLITFTTTITYWYEASWASTTEMKNQQLHKYGTKKANTQIIHNLATQRLHRACLLSQMQTHLSKEILPRYFVENLSWLVHRQLQMGKGIGVDVRAQQKAGDNQG